MHTGNIFTWMWYFLTPYRNLVIGFSIYRAVRYTIISLFPLVTGYLIDGLSSGAAQENATSYIIALGGYAILFFISVFNIIFIPEVAAFEKTARGLTLYGIKHLNKLSLNWHEKEGSGGKLQRVMTGRKGFQEFTRHIRWDAFPLVGDLIAITITVLITDVPLIYFPMFLGFLGSYLFCSWFFARGYFDLYDNFNKKFEKLLSGVYEFVSSIRTVKAFHLSRYIDHKADRLEEEGQEAVMSAFSMNLTRWTICNIVGGLWMFLFSSLGFYWVLNDTITVGSYAATVLLASYLWTSCEVLGAILEKFYEYGNGIHRLIETLRITPKQLDLSPAQNLPKDWKTISLKNLSFAYDENESQGIHNVSFSVNRGEKIAFVGNSGAGKSTLVKLLMKQMLPDNGKFCIDHTSIPHIKTETWLNQIGFVPQDVELFNLTIRENILIDRDNIESDLLNNVLRESALDDFIDNLPEGIDTIIGERGIKLSGGQRQRLGIARALIRQAPIMIFDEATSSLDSISESKIQNAIENSFEGRTVFVIAHRLSTIRNVDRIIVLDEGRIIEDGNFNDLLDKKGHFEKLWSLQSKETPQK
jgi:ATP-binding cassette subfamily B protein